MRTRKVEPTPYFYSPYSTEQITALVTKMRNCQHTSVHHDTRRDIKYEYHSVKCYNCELKKTAIFKQNSEEEGYVYMAYGDYTYTVAIGFTENKNITLLISDIEKFIPPFIKRLHELEEKNRNNGGGKTKRDNSQ